ncbi:MAG: hypothetical protein RIS88_2961 [Pseudomonadota bacterium]|jgi:hypothetical protein
MTIDAGAMSREVFLAGLAAAGFPPPVPVTRDASYALGDHAHDFEAWALVTEGELTIEVAGIATRFLAGRSFRLPADTSHKEWAGPQGVQYLAGRKG